MHSRVLLTLVAVGTITVAPLAEAAIGPAGGGQSAHSSPVYLLALASHNVGRNDWAYQGGLQARISWAATYVVLGLFWLAVALWMRHRTGRAPTAGVTKHLWLKTLGAAWGAELLAGALVVGGAGYAEYTSTQPGPLVLRVIDVCSPWWSAVAAPVVVATAERDARAMGSAIAFGVLLACVLLVPAPVPNGVKALFLAVPMAVGALLERRSGGAARESTSFRPRVGAAG
jgi:hypothetical protein